MRIGLVLPALPKYSETFFSNKVSGLVQLGHEVTIYVHSPTGIKSYHGARVISIIPPNRLSLVFYLDVVFKLGLLLFYRFRMLKLYQSLLKSEGYSFLNRLKLTIVNRNLLMYSQDWLHFGFGTMVIHRELVPKAIGAKMAVSFRGFDIAIFPLSHPDCYKTLWKHVDKIHVISDDLRDKVLQNGGQQLMPLCVKITPAIDVDFFQRTQPLPDFTPPYQITTIARLHWKKGLVYTLKALRFLKNEGIPFHYTIIGSGEEEERLRFVVCLLGLQEEVTFAGKLTQEEIKTHLEKTHLYIQYSIQEGFCNAVLEAQSMGVFCVVSDAEGLSENVKEGQTGYVIPRRKPVQLFSAIETYLSNRYKSEYFNEVDSYERIKRDFSLEEQIKLFNKFYL